MFGNWILNYFQYLGMLDRLIKRLIKQYEAIMHVHVGFVIFGHSL